MTTEHQLSQKNILKGMKNETQNLENVFKTTFHLRFYLGYAHKIDLNNN